ncbi:MAG: tetratricopeptide repeat protein [Kiritimatiellia bacterium]|jgi:tetratricopeptide (TPR) repeat protein
MKFSRLFTMAALVALGAAPVALGNVPARVEMANGQGYDCRIRWMPASKRYAITRPTGTGSGAMEQQVTPAEIVRKQVAPPPGWSALVQQAAKAPDAALPKLLQLVDEYKMLEYDEYAAFIIGQIYLQRNRHNDFIKVAEKVIQDNPAAASRSKMAPLYWTSLIETGKTAGGQLEKMLDDAVANASTDIAAKALVARGDQLKKAGRTRDALKDGYLRVVFLYGREREAHAEALYKAAVAFDELQQTPYADKMRQTLLSRYKDSPFAQKLRGN